MAAASEFGATGALWLANPRFGPPATNGAPGAQPRQLLALIVEDELLVGWHLESLLEELGHQVCGVAPSAKAAIADYREFEPDLVFMDVNLGPGPSGVDAARELLALRQAPMIFVTAYGDPAVRAAIAEAAPGSVMLSKPVTAADLARAIEAVMRARH